jgi:Cu+-exporting ATPase
MATATSNRTRQEIQLKVKGMHCPSCAAVVQRAIESRPGVHEASVSVTDGLATVTGDDLETDALVRAVRDRGYEAEALADTPAPSELRSDIEMRQATAARLWGRRAVLGLGVWVPMAAIHWAAEAMGRSGPWLPWLMLIGASVVLLGAGAGFYRSAWSAARHGTTNMDTLIAMGATTAYVYSLVVFTLQRAGVDITQPLYFGESAALLGIISLGHWLEARASARAGSAVRELLELQPDQAEVFERHGDLVTVASAEVQPGDRMLIRPGARVPVDGVVVEGASDIDESVVSGESTPVRKSEGDTVVAGSVNTTGRLVVEATVDGHHTTVARIAEMVQRAQTSKAHIQRLADRVCAVFVPAVLTIAAVTFAAWWLLGDLATGVIATVTVLIISCPCALGLGPSPARGLRQDRNPHRQRAGRDRDRARGQRDGRGGSLAARRRSGDAQRAPDRAGHRRRGSAPRARCAGRERF